MLFSARLALPLTLMLTVSLACGNDDEPSADTDVESSTTRPSTSTSSSTSSGEAGTGTTGAENQPPPSPVLMTPTNASADVETQTELCWEPAVDPDGDAVRYRVWVDGMELTDGKLGTEPGHAGPCIGPLAFNFQQTYAWTVSAFEVDNPEHESDQAEPFEFTTVQDLATVVFEDNFEDDKGWEVEGDATSGAWIRGNPVPTTIGLTVAQPGDCAGGENCYFTGQNPDGLPLEADVEGTTVLVSPEFDLAGFGTASVSLSRFFFKSDADETGTLYRVELLIPDESEPGGYQAFVLEQLESLQQVATANMWVPVEYAACGIPMVDSARLRVTVADLGDGITEGGLDTVTVSGYADNKLCTGGEGSICDPTATDACSDGHLCCPQGVLNTGVYRCAEPVEGYDYDNPPNWSGTDGCDAPDLLVTDTNMDIELVNRDFAPTDCAIFEGCVDGPGTRRLLRFDTNTPNQGSRDLTMGVPSNHPDLFHYSECHDHYHFDGYAVYDLLDLEGNVVAQGHKQAFCLLDFENWSGMSGSGYSCFNQGISAGWQDNYYLSLPCQWVDVTGVAAGNYTLRLRVNWPAEGAALPPLVERDYSNNELLVPVTLP